MRSATRGRWRRGPFALALAAAALSTAGADVAAAVAPVPCTDAGGGRFNCQFYPSGGAPVQSPDGAQVGTLHQGTNWVLCQRTGTEVRSGPYHNIWWAYTLADNNRYGWVNAVYARGGDNNGRYDRVPDCGATRGNPPGGSQGPGTPPPPPAPAPPPPSQQPPASGTPGKPRFEAPWPCGEVRSYSHHSSEVSNALDFNIAGRDDRGTPVLASASGKVISAKKNGGYGNEVVIDHGGGWSSRVAHLDTIGVRLDQIVKQGDRIGTVGTTGRSSGPHLHYEQRLNRKRQPIVLGGVALRYSTKAKTISARPCR